MQLDSEPRAERRDADTPPGVAISGGSRDLRARRRRGFGALASTVRDTVYAMVDALRGRYDC